MRMTSTSRTSRGLPRIARVHGRDPGARNPLRPRSRRQAAHVPDAAVSARRRNDVLADRLPEEPDERARPRRDARRDSLCDDHYPGRRSRGSQGHARCPRALLRGQERRLPEREPRAEAGDGAEAIAAALRDTRADDAAILWLRPADRAALPATQESGAAIFVSGLMGKLEDAPLPARWRAVARMTYPFDLPSLRRVRMNFPLG